MVDDLCESIIVSSAGDDWESMLKECLGDPNKIECLSAQSGVQSISISHGLDLYSAALLYHSDRRD